MHQGEELWDPGMTLTFVTTRSTWLAYAFELIKLLECHLKGNTLVAHAFEWGKLSFEGKNLKEMGKWTED